MSDNGRFQVLWITLTLMIMATIYLIGFNYYNSLRSSKRKVLDRLKAITCTASLQIDIDAHQRLTNRWKQKGDSVDQINEYQFIHHQLQAIQKVNELSSPINTLAYDSSYHLFQFIVTSAEYSTFRQDYIHFPSTLLEKYNQGSTIEEYESETGEWLSAFAPLKDARGRTVALLQADENCSQFIVLAHQQLIQQAVVAFVTVSPLVLLLFAYTRRFLERQKQNEEALRKQQVAIAHQSSIIKKQNEKLLKKNQEIEFANNALDIKVKDRTQALLATTQELQTYLYRSSHDMRGPLSSLLGLCNLLISEKKIEPYAQLIYQASLRLIQRTQSLSDVFEIKSKEIRHAKLDVCQLINEVDKSLEVEGDANYIVCRDAGSCEEIFMEGDLLRMILKEVVHNSVYHNRFSGRQTKIWIKANLNSEVLVFEVRDDGLGMPEAVKEKAFEMFFRGNEQSQGIGLGLFKVKMIAERMDGKVMLETVEGHGTTFLCILPLRNVRTY